VGLFLIKCFGYFYVPSFFILVKHVVKFPKCIGRAHYIIEYSFRKEEGLYHGFFFNEFCDVTKVAIIQMI
jgi:hypothetical protein